MLADAEGRNLLARMGLLLLAAVCLFGSIPVGIITGSWFLASGVVLLAWVLMGIETCVAKLSVPQRD
jgi:hypothetical protein